MRVLCAFADLKEDSQQAFNGALNEYLLASPTKRRQLLKQWREHIGDLTRSESAHFQSSTPVE
ncbi:hypothetical protein WJ47_02460 [Burkholderia ubonensis]|uniref:Uncharacterized protein n=2 Tax=Burkholderia ubonensis TaxID=101571 RepID=A0AB73G845_9BURK|nr:hypothetical protein WJ44_25785 [Burkholderia ubonensis]KVL73346.1 hypothetical protein WJ47_02460 [Burkholderia ubonensis]KVM35609.1 hypothetical protein WJ54_04460 [Burkholderia ubonensis]KVM39022.1 hypothetical protein WJ53_26300 [Burkholderia ubonensis]